MAEAKPGGHRGPLKLEVSLGAKPAGPPGLPNTSAFVLSQREANSGISERKEDVLKDLLTSGQRTSGVTTLIANSSGKTFLSSIDCFDQSHFFSPLRILNRNDCHMHPQPIPRPAAVEFIFFPVLYSNYYFLLIYLF